MDVLTGPLIRDNARISLDTGTAKTIGGKALGLHEIKALGISVPPWDTLTVSFFERICSNDSHLVQLLTKKKIEPREKAESVRQYIKEIQLDDVSSKILIGIWDRISEGGRKPVAVRSSAADEDSKSLSFAGQMDSFLNVRSFDSFVDSIKNCWASLFGDRVVSYKTHNKADPWRPQMAVIVQQMIEPDISGVIFSANPLTGNREEMMVSSVWGLGEGLVSGALDADTFLLDQKGDLISGKIAEKKQKISCDVSGGTKLVNIEDGKPTAPSLTNEQLKKLHKIALRIQKLKGTPVDIEFGMKKSSVYLLQARPITNLKEYAGKEDLNIWDNSNISESYSGITMPLTFSFIQKAYFAVYWQFCETIGVSRTTIIKNKTVLENMLGLIQGRVYYNLLNWYRIVSLMPGFRYNKHFMEQMMGLQVVGDFRPDTTARSRFGRYFVHLPSLMKVGIKMALAHIRLQRSIAEFQTNFKLIYNNYSQLDYSKMAPAGMLKVYRELENKVLWKWKAPITNDFEAMIFYGFLKSLTVKLGVDPQGVLQNDLLCGEGGIRSTQVTSQIFYIAQEIARDPRSKSEFLDLTPEKALEKLRSDTKYSSANERFIHYLEDYGVRSIDEMKLEAVPIRENPVFCVATVQNYLRNNIPDPEIQAKHEQGIREKAEALLRGKLKNRRFMFVIPALNIYLWVLNNARRAIKNRENQRFCRAEAYDLVRRIMRAIGKHWQGEKIIENAEDVFYLKMDEIWDCIEGKLDNIELKDIIASRKEEYGEYKKVTPPDHIETYGRTVPPDVFETGKKLGLPGGVIKGLGCCAGIVEKEVMVVLKPDSDLRLNGEIMVARQTDPGWVVLFPSISGLIVEKGSMLSHSAIVAREMGIPAVVGVKNATEILSSGDRVLLNGSEGTVRILNKAKP